MSLNKATILALVPWSNSNLVDCILTPTIFQLLEFGVLCTSLFVH